MHAPKNILGTFLSKDAKTIKNYEWQYYMTTADTVYTLAIVYLIIAIVLPMALVIVFGIFLLCYLEKTRKMALSGLVTPDMIREEEELPPYSEAP
jgi:hypothetical protein